MATFVDIIGPIYQDLLRRCEHRKISVNIDFQNLTRKISDVSAVEKFYQTEIKRALANCAAGDKITLAQSVSEDCIRLSVKNSGLAPLTDADKEKLRSSGYEVRSRFGYDTIITLKLPL